MTVRRWSRDGRAAACAAAWLLTAAAAGCIVPEETVATDLPAEGWSSAATLRYTNADTLARRELKLFLRLDEAFREDSLTLRIETFTPDSLRTFEYHRLAVGGRHTATPLQAVVEVPYRRGVRLRRAGDYYFVLTPVRPVYGAEAVGMRVTNRSTNEETHGKR